jgi:hypothetical protein
MYNTDHLNTLQLRLSHERARLANATKPDEIVQRSVWVAQCEKEVQREIEFLKSKGVNANKEPLEDIDTDDLYKMLMEA